MTKATGEKGGRTVAVEMRQGDVTPRPRPWYARAWQLLRRDTRARAVEDAPPREEPRWKGPLLGWSAIVLVLALWQIAADTGVINKVFSSEPTAVAKTMWTYITSDTFLGDLGYTTQAFAIGLGISIVAGVALGAALGRITWFRQFCDYLISISYAAPRIALAPLIILWFGIGMKSSIIIVVLIAIYPVMMNTTTAMRTIDVGYLDLGRSLKMSRVDLLRYIMLPASVPSILTGIRLAIGLGLIGVVIAEFLVGTQGIGYHIKESAANYQSDEVVAGLVLITTGGVVLTGLVKALERRFDRWRTA